LSVIEVSFSIKSAQISPKAEWRFFGSLAIVAVKNHSFRSTALRPRLSAGLPLSNKRMIRFKQNELGQKPGSPK